ncbi:hypothetical protein BDF14DRAFT_1782225 [Spinellus fusiger]|nr:hypothetical protein BDF14DRAFT_1782225 [Spinellus fusiger]
MPSLQRSPRPKTKLPYKSHLMPHHVNMEKYATLLSLIDATYPPLLCTQCDTVSSNRRDSSLHFRHHHPSTPRFLCLYSHCTMKFGSRGALRFHLAHSHCTRLMSMAVGSASLSDSMSTPLSTNTLATTPTPTPASTPTPRTKTKTKTKTTPKAATTPTPTLTFPYVSPSSTYTAVPYSRAPRGSKKMILSASSNAVLDAVYPPLQCPACLKAFNRKTNVIKHLTDEHPREEPYRCVFEHCIHPRRYATREGLVYHIVRAHEERCRQETHQDTMSGSEQSV